MTNPRASLEVKRFYEFWLWQYTARNPEYKEAYRKLKEGPNRKAAIEQIRDKFGCTIEDPSEGTDSGQILDRVLKGEDLTAGISFTRYSIDRNKIKDIDEDRFFYIVDLREDLETILAEVKFLYATGKASKSYSSLENFCDYWDLEQKERATLFQQYLKGGHEKFTLDNKLRAAGLCLWDYVKAGGKPGGKGFGVYDAIKKLYALLGERPHGFGDSKDESAKRRLSRYYNLTAKCIQERKVLPVQSGNRE